MQEQPTNSMGDNGTPAPEPGVQVVEDNDEEVFFVDGYYWHPGPDGVWFRTRTWRGGWVARGIAFPWCWGRWCPRR